MDIFTLLILKLIPFYAIILLGFLAGKFLDAKKETLASILIYIILPVVVFSGVVKTDLSFGNLSLPFLIFILCCLICLMFLFLGRFFWNDSTKNILAFAAGSGNVGYFGLPVVLTILGNDAFDLAVLIIVGYLFYESSLGFYIVAKGNFSVKDSIKKLLTLPSIYALFLGVFVNISGMNLGLIYEDAVANFKSAYTVLGMMLIGLALAEVQKVKLDAKFISFAFLAKFLVCPALVFSFIFIDKTFLHMYGGLAHNVLILMSVMPIAANTVAYAAVLKVHPQKASLAVFLSTLFALLFIPIISSILIF